MVCFICLPTSSQSSYSNSWKNSPPDEAWLLCIMAVWHFQSKMINKINQLLHLFLHHTFHHHHYHWHYATCSPRRSIWWNECAASPTGWGWHLVMNLVVLKTIRKHVKKNSKLFCMLFVYNVNCNHLSLAS